VKNIITKSFDILLKKQNLGILILLLICLLPYFYVGLFSNPIADDFVYAYKAKTNSMHETLIIEYMNWNGRYISNIFVLLNPIAFGLFDLYKIIPIFLIIISVLSLYIFINSIVENIISKMQKLIFSLTIMLLFLYQMPIISEGIYWFTGSVTYQLGLVSFLIYLSVYVMYLKSKYIFTKRWIHLLVLFLLILITVGFNEIIMIVMFLLPLIIWTFSIAKLIYSRKVFFYVFIFTTICCCIMYFAPGNSVRESHFSVNHRLVTSLLFSSAQTIRFTLDWISSLPLIIISVLYFGINKNLSKKLILFQKSFYLKPVISILILIAIVFIGSFPAYWATGMLGQHRTMNVSYFLFIIMWFINLTVIYNKIQIPSIKEIKYSKIIFYTLFFFSLSFTKNSYNILYDIFSGSAKEYNKQMQDRYLIINSGSCIIYFEPIKNPPKSIFVLDISDNPNYWINKSYTLFFNKSEIKIKAKH